MARRLMLVAAVGLTAVPLGAGPAEAGASCAGGYEVASGATVSMKQDCFLATVVHVEPGDRVTFVNDDPYPHSVAGAAGTFGEPHEGVASGGSVAFRFDEEGVFPYFCTYHPGMAGAVVVGDGIGTATVGKAAASRVAAQAPKVDRPDAGSDESISGLGTAAWASAAAGTGFAGGLLLRRRRTR